MDFTQIAILLSSAAVFGIIAKFFKQPLIIGYLLAGFLLGSLGIIHEASYLEGFSNIGVALLLFLLGVEMNLSELPTIGKTALLTGVGQIVFTSVIGFLISSLLGFDITASLYIAIALTFSSTIIMVKLLSEKKQLSSLFGKISIGFLLVQDFVAVIVLMVLSGFSSTDLITQPADYLFKILTGLALIAVIYFLSRKIIPNLWKKFATSNELLFVVSVAWALAIASLTAGPLGFTLEIGGFLAGIALSNLPEHLQIASRTKPLRDFFLTIFFLSLGAKLVLDVQVISILLPAILFSSFVLIGNPLIVMAILGLLGYKKRTSFMAGLAVAQISEFSFIIVGAGAALGHISGQIVSMVIIVGIITMTISTYLIMNSDFVYERLKDYLDMFEREKPRERAFLKEAEMKNHIVVVGADRTGTNIIKHLAQKDVNFLVVDFNPRVFTQLTSEKIDTVFGDIADKEILAASNLRSAKTIISTTNDLESNLTILEHVRSAEDKPTCIFTSATRDNAIKLYEKGADYVIVPDVVAGDHIIHLFKAYGMSGKKLESVGKKHFDKLIFT